jgi:hypothetical protein
MTDSDVARRRLDAQRLWRPDDGDPTDVVRWMGAVQSQDYTASLLGVGLRTRGGTEQGVEDAIARRTVVRVHFMRNTVHLVPALDLRWMMRLMAPRIRRLIGNVARANGVPIDESTYARSNEVIAAELAGGGQASRAELSLALERAGVRTGAELAVMLLVQRAQVDGLVCAAPRHGRQDRLVLVDEWLPPGPTLDRDEAVAELARRYFRSHGPATVSDFVWWSGLTVADARAALEALGTELATEARDGQTYWYAERPPPVDRDGDVAYLLGNYDEYLVGYKDRTAVFDPAHRPKLTTPTRNVLFAHTVVVNGEVVGTWRRARQRDGVSVRAELFRPLSSGEVDAVAAAVERVGAFLGRAVELTTTDRVERTG